MNGANFTILVVLLAFLILAFILLFPIYRFLKREEQDAGKHWTREAVRRRIEEENGNRNGSPGRERPPSRKNQ